MKDFFEIRIIRSVKTLLTGKVNEILREYSFEIPIIEFCAYGCGYGAVPVISLSSCECSEKERIVRLNTYMVTVTFAVPETPESELHCYAYSGAVSQAIAESPTLGGGTVTVTSKKFTPPKKLGCGENWLVTLTLRLTVEEIGDTHVC